MRATVADLNLTDPMIRDMADRNHVPSETWTLSGQLIRVACDACGNTWPCPTRKTLQAMKDSQGDPMPDPRPLSPRMVECLRAAATGLTDEGIAASLGISRHTVITHLYRARRRLGAPTTKAAVAAWLRTKSEQHQSPTGEPR